jgi:malonate-semialdehyde dehydrogenase (acetylating) / methylmalonate-semialdehyde dehydrogenase
VQVGAGKDPDTDVGPVISQQSLQRIHTLIQSGVDDGADLVVDGRGANVSGYDKGASTCDPRRHDPFLGPTMGN